MNATKHTRGLPGICLHETLGSFLESKCMHWLLRHQLSTFEHNWLGNKRKNAQDELTCSCGT